jgi:cell division protein FtsB
MVRIYHGNWAPFRACESLNPVSDLAAQVQRLLPLAMLATAVIAVPVLIFEPDGLPRMRALEKELADVNAENAELRRDVTKLRAEVKQLRDDPTAVERIARDQLGLVRKSEVVVQFGARRE